MNRLKYYRENLCMTQAELAEKSGINVRMIQKYEQGDRDLNKASGETLHKLARAIGCDVDDLIQKYVVTSTRGDEEWIESVHVDVQKATEAAWKCWDSLVPADKATNVVEVRAYLYDDGGEDGDLWDYDVIDWATWYAVLRDDEDDDWGFGSSDLDEAKAMAGKYGDDAYIAVINAATGVCIDEIREW